MDFSSKCKHHGPVRKGLRILSSHAGLCSFLSIAGGKVTFSFGLIFERTYFASWGSILGSMAFNRLIQFRYGDKALGLRLIHESLYYF